MAGRRHLHPRGVLLLADADSRGAPWLRRRHCRHHGMQQAEEELRQTEKLSALGKLSAGPQPGPVLLAE